MKLLRIAVLAVLIAWMAWITWRQEYAISLIERTCNVVATVNDNLAASTGKKTVFKTDFDHGCPWKYFVYPDDAKPR